ncbi:MAG: hypothetical protein ACODAJ_10555 [Planctomycetota bacterium]
MATAILVVLLALWTGGPAVVVHHLQLHTNRWARRLAGRRVGRGTAN